MKKTFKTATEWLEWVDSLPKELQDVMKDFWDVTGRPTTDLTERRVICRLLKMSNTFTEFNEKVKLILGDNKNTADYWDGYLTGIEAAVEYLKRK